jgi:hypothetical protein
VIAQAHFDTVQLPFPPAIVQRIGPALGAPLGRALGYQSVLAPAAAPVGAPAVTAAGTHRNRTVTRLRKEHGTHAAAA